METGPEIYFTTPVDRSITLERSWTPPVVWLIRVDLQTRHSSVDQDWPRER